jgi:exodeoxyribonuclease V gamma subunit
VAALGDLLSVPPGDPVAAEVVAVPTRGVERWITQRLAHRLGAGPTGEGGVCANLDYPFPGTLVARASAQATGIDPAVDPWAPDRLVWTLIDVLDSRAEDPVLAPLVQHLAAVTPPPRPSAVDPGAGKRPERPRRFATARHIAELFDRYAVHRPDMIQEWAAGGPADAGAPDAGSGAGPPGAGWQPHLWRLVRQAVTAPSPAERLSDAVARIVSDPGSLDLPERLSVFGLTRLPAGHLLVLDAIAAHRDVHLFLLHPSGRLWERAASLAGRPDRPPRRVDDPTARLPEHPLLRSWGRDSREMQLVLSTTRAGAGRHYPVEAPPAPTLLSRIQADVRADRPPGGGAAETPGPAELAASDRSLQIHACHGRMRQVEVLRDALLHLLEDDPTLEPRDIIVMCPDIETYAPLVHAAFGVDAVAPGSGGGSSGSVSGGAVSGGAVSGGAVSGGAVLGSAGSGVRSGRLAAASDRSGRPADAAALRIRLADRSLRQTNPLLSVAAGLLELAGSRMTAPAVTDFVSRPAVSRRFGFDQEDLATIERWVAGTAVRWGLDGPHRRPWSLNGLYANTWAAGLDRLMLGVAMSEGDSRTFAGTVPYEDITSSQVDLAGRLAELIARLGDTLDRLVIPQPAGAWIQSLVEGTEALACSPTDELWQHEEMRSALAEVVAGPDAIERGAVLTLDEARLLLADELRGRPTRANFRTGDLTICTLFPMRSVPHRVVALLGLDDGAFPRHPEVDGDDLLLAEPRVGDRDTRSEDRQLLLDALLAATDHLVITYCGRDERTNRPRPPCAPVAELLDVVDATARPADGGRARDTVVVHHPLQPFDARNFIPDRRLAGRPWSFDLVHLEGARSSLRPSPPPAPAAGPLPSLSEPVVRLEDLVAFVQHPARSFLRRRLSLYLGDWADELDDRLPVELDPLERWGLGDRLLEAVTAGVDLERAVSAERARGLLPPGALATRVVDDVAPGVAGLTSAIEHRGLPAGPAQAAQVQFDLPGGPGVFGTVPLVRGATILQCVYSRLGAKHRLAAWVRFLALTADRPEVEVSAVSIGRDERRGSVAVSTFRPPPGPPDHRRAWAIERLAVVLDLFERGMVEPIPMACATSAAWAAGRAGRRDEDGLLTATASAWAPSGDIPGERDQPEHVFLYGRHADFRVLLKPRPEPDETGPGWADDEVHRFGRLARRLWDPVLSHESRVVE